MKTVSCGYAWKRRAEVAPALLAAWRLARRLAGSRFRLQYPFWALDYSFHDIGAYRVASPGRRWRARLARTAHLYPPEMPYWEDYRGLRGSLAHSAYIIFLGGEAAGLDRLVPSRCGYARFLDPEGVLGELIEETARAGHRGGEDGFWPAQSVFCRIIGVLLASQPVEGETRRIQAGSPAGAPSELVRAADAYLWEHLAGRVTLAGLAGHLGVSVSTLAHRYRQETGEPPMLKLTRLRINLAKGLLLKGQPLKAIAEAAGFSDAFHLSKTFKRMEGAAPKHFLASLRAGN